MWFSFLCSPYIWFSFKGGDAFRNALHSVFERAGVCSAVSFLESPYPFFIDHSLVRHTVHLQAILGI